MERARRRRDRRLARHLRPDHPRGRARDGRGPRPPLRRGDGAAVVPGHGRRQVSGLPDPDGEPDRRRPGARGESGRPERISVRLARHERRGRSGVHGHARQQRARLRRPDERQHPGSGQRPERRARSGLRLSAEPRGAPARLAAGVRDEPLLLEQRDPRRHAQLRLRRGVGQLPGQQLRQRRARQRRRSRRGAGRQRPQQRQLRHRRRRRAASDADVRVALVGPEPDQGEQRSAGSADVLRPDGRLRREPRHHGPDHRRRRLRGSRLRPGVPDREHHSSRRSPSIPISPIRRARSR